MSRNYNTLAMNSSVVVRIPVKLASEFHETFPAADTAQKLKFIQKYFRFLEEENSSFKNLFVVENPVFERIEKMQQVLGLEKACLTLLRKMSRDRSSKVAGSPCSQAWVFLGISYELGALGVKKCEHTAFRYYDSAAKLRDPLGTFRLGQCYEKGIGTMVRMDKALTFYRVAAKLGSVEALHTFGAVLLYGECGIEKDMSAGMLYLQLAAKQSDTSYPYPFFDLAKCYDPDNDACTVPDAEYALDLYNKGAHLGCPNCQHRIAKAYEYAELTLDVDINHSVAWYKKACESGHIDAQLAMSNFYFRGVPNFLPADNVQAYFWALKAACKGHPHAAFAVAEFIETGIGVKPDMVHALWWYSIAASLGHTQANTKITDISSEIKGWEEPYNRRWWNWLF